MTRRGGGRHRARAAVPMDIPVRAVVHLVTCDDPMRYTGRILRAAEFVSGLDDRRED